MGCLLPGGKTIPHQIAASKNPYYMALEAADRTLANENHIDVSELEKLIGAALASQFVEALEKAGAGGERADGGNARKKQLPP